jgi:hypothetical protein
MIRHHASLFDDLARDRTLDAARRRRTGRRLGNSLAMIAALAAASVLALHDPAAESPTSGTTIPPKLPAAAPAPTRTTPAVHRIASDDELLEVLADQGPMLVTASDGQRYLVLTRPN